MQEEHNHLKKAMNENLKWMWWKHERRSAFIYALMWLILTVSVVHSCFILYEKLLRQFIKSLQIFECSKTGMLINLHLQFARAQYHRAQLSIVFTFMQMTSSCYRITVHTSTHIRLVGYNCVFCPFMRETSDYRSSLILLPFQLKKKPHVFCLKCVTAQTMLYHIWRYDVAVYDWLFYLFFSI